MLDRAEADAEHASALDPNLDCALVKPHSVANSSSMGQWNFSSIHAQAIHEPRAGQAGRRVWMEIGRCEGRPSQLQAPSEPVYSHDRASPKGCTSGRAVDTVKKIRLELK